MTHRASQRVHPPLNSAHRPLRSSVLRKTGSALATLCVAWGFGTPALAQYKIVGPDGKITFSDRPVAAADTKVQAFNAKRGAGPSLSNLPYDLAQLAGRYPTTIYTTSQSCAGCDQGKQMLKARGIPFAERTVNSPEDIAELKKQTGGTELPVLRVGPQTLKGYSPADWGNLLDVAGYPTESRLPSNYAFSAPSPLAEPKAIARKEEPKPVETPVEPNTGAGGIRF